MEKIINIDINELIENRNSFNRVFLDNKAINLDEFLRYALTKDEYSQYLKDLGESKVSAYEEFSFDYNLKNSVIGIFYDKKPSLIKNNVPLDKSSHIVKSIYLNFLNGEIIKIKIKIKTLNTKSGIELENNLLQNNISMVLRSSNSSITGFDFTKNDSN